MPFTALIGDPLSQYANVEPGGFVPPDGLEYLQISPSYDAQHVQNVVSTSTADGVAWPDAGHLPAFGSGVDLAATVGQIKSPTSVAAYYQSVISRSPNIARTSAAYGDRSQELTDQAAYLIAELKNAKYRFDSISFQPVDNASLWVQALGKEVSDRVTVKRHPANKTTGGGGNLIRRDCFVESVAWAMTGVPEEWVISLQLTPAGSLDDYPLLKDTPTWAIIEDPLFGVFDVGNAFTY